MLVPFVDLKKQYVSIKTEIDRAIESVIAETAFIKGKYVSKFEDEFSNLLSTSDFPDPDLLIRTGDEIRISNFFLWQISYSELYFSKLLWPDFKLSNFKSALNKFSTRDRRFGKE